MESHNPNHIFFKLINPEHIDWVGLGKNILLVESKHVKEKRHDKIVYYTKNKERKRNQLKAYFDAKQRIHQETGLPVRVALLICKGVLNSKEAEIIYVEPKTYDEIAIKY